MNIVLMGSKGAGKSTLGEALAAATGLEAIDTDRRIETLYEEQAGKAATCRTIFQSEGEERFRALERTVALECAGLDYRLIVTGGGMMMDPDSRRALRNNAILVFLRADADTLWARATEKGLPPWLTGDDG
jgi:shikimate kinase